MCSTLTTLFTATHTHTRTHKQVYPHSAVRICQGCSALFCFFFAFCVFLCARFRTHRSTHPFAKKQPTNQRAQSVFLALFLTSPPLFLTFLPLWKPREGPKRLLRL